MFLFLLLLLNFTWAGRVYEIAEPDLMQEIEERIPQAVQRVKKEIENFDLRTFRPSFLVSLPRAKKSKTYEVDMTYELEFDIPRVDEKGRQIGVLYPKGYKFNPLHYAPVDPPELIVFNPKIKEEVEFVKKYIKNRMNVVLLAVDTGIFDLFKVMGRPIYYLHERIANRLTLKGTLSIIRWDRKKGTAVVEVFGEDAFRKED